MYAIRSYYEIKRARQMALLYYTATHSGDLKKKMK